MPGSYRNPTTWLMFGMLIFFKFGGSGVPEEVGIGGIRYQP